MSVLSEIVQLTITQNSVGLARAGFGIPLILSANATFTERYRTYDDLGGFAGDFSDTSSPEYLAASALFAQSPAPQQVSVGRCANKPTLVYVIGVVQVVNTHTYLLNVVGQGVTTTALAVTSDSSATNDEIVALLVTALNGVTGKNYTAVATGSVGSKVVTVTATAAGNWFSLEVVALADLSCAITHVDSGVAADLNAIQIENNDWYAVYSLYNSNAYTAAIAAWAETQSKIYVFDAPDSLGATAAISGGDLFDALHTSAYTRTAGMFHPNPSAMAAAAWMGTCLPLDPGSETWKFKQPAGVAAVKLTATQRGNIEAKKANVFVATAGITISINGTTASGGFIDVRRGLDWLIDDMTKAVFGALAAASKVPFTDAGVALIENEVRGSLGRAVAQGVLSSNPFPTVTAPLVKSVSTQNKAGRILPDIKWQGELAGAIHSVIIQGVVSV